MLEDSGFQNSPNLCCRPCVGGQKSWRITPWEQSSINARQELVSKNPSSLSSDGATLKCVSYWLPPSLPHFPTSLLVSPELPRLITFTQILVLGLCFSIFFHHCLPFRHFFPYSLPCLWNFKAKDILYICLCAVLYYYVYLCLIQKVIFCPVSAYIRKEESLKVNELSI